jgi:hypothetical protein
MAGALGFFLLRFIWPSWSGVMPDCTVRRLTGLYCPGCGGTRCAGRLLEGDIAGAFTMNAVVVILAAVVAVLLTMAVIREWKGHAQPLPLLPPWFAWGVTVLVLGFGLVRNLPWWPFTLLVPH